MPLVPWNCAAGDPPPVTLPAAATVPIAPPDDSVDTNSVIISGTGTITSLGAGPSGVLITKKVTLKAVGGPLTLAHTPPALMLLGGQSHTVPSGTSCVSTIQWDGASVWTEQAYSDLNARPISLPAGTVMMFVQAAAPTGWTKLTTHDNKALRVVAGTTGGTGGGTMTFTGCFYNRDTTYVGGTEYTVGQRTDPGVTFEATAGHEHNVQMDVMYVDTLLASKD